MGDDEVTGAGFAPRGDLDVRFGAGYAFVVLQCLLHIAQVEQIAICMGTVFQRLARWPVPGAQRISPTWLGTRLKTSAPVCRFWGGASTRVVV